MRQQQKIWTEEHKRSSSIPGMADTKPSKGVEWFFEEIKPKKGKLVDIGCGKGRNSVFAAKHDLEVFGVDFVDEALKIAEKLAKKHKVTSKVHFSKAEIGLQWPFENNFFDYAIDCYSSIDVDIKSERETYRDELYRTLNPKGYALVMVVSSEDELEKEMIEKYPGSEKNSAIWPNGKFQKDYDKDELLEFYKDFKVIKLKESSKKAYKLNRDYISKNYWLILQKL